MRIWHYKLLPYLPDLQFKGQHRELIAIMRGWRDKGKTNHLLINAVMDYSKEELLFYYELYRKEYEKRYDKCLSDDEYKEFFHFAFGNVENAIIGYSPERFIGWHNDEYLKICMANLCEKHISVGKSRITDEEWTRLANGYKEITGRDYEL